jgi:acylglycerol lipase
MLDPAPRIDYFSAADGYRSAVRIWDANPPIGRIVWLHGIISHGGWYLATCSHLARAGLEVHFLDRRGSGLNADRRGDVDYFETWLSDVEEYLDSLAADLPTILMGVSWGGKLAAAVARRNRRLIDGLGLICPGLFAKKGPGGFGRFALHFASALGLLRTRVTVPLQDPALFTDCPPWQDYVAHDPFTLRRVTVSFALADEELTRYATESPEKISVPVLLMLAGRDRIIDNQRVRALVQRMAAADKQIIEYPAAAHTLDFEPAPAQFRADLTGWAKRVSVGEGGVRRRA